MAAHSLAFEAWVEEARGAALVDVARERSPTLRRGGSELVGPCPACGGRDRFSISLRKNLWHCRKAAKGGDVIGLVEYVEGVDFLRACEILTGRPAPGRDVGETAEDRAAREAALRERRRLAAEEEARRIRKATEFRCAERGRAHKIWRATAPAHGTAIENYFRLRGLTLPPEADLRFAEALPYFVERQGPNGERLFVELFRGPAMVAGIRGAEGHFAGVHQTWLDLDDPDGKRRIVDPETNARLPTKKLRGTKDGARIELVRHPEPRRLFLGEGIETSLSAYQALARLGSPLAHDAAVWSGLDLGNIAGRALDKRRHPQRVNTAPDGSTRPLNVAGPLPDPADAAIPIPESVTELWLLGDGDSDRFTTEMALRRGAARLAREGLTIKCAWADPGQDFNTMLRGAAA